MAGKNRSTGKERQQADPRDLEEVEHLIRCSHAVATLIHCDNAFDETVARSAAGAVCELLLRAEKIMEGEVRHG